jgi:PadR family transcriptional regulator PadR
MRYVVLGPTMESLLGNTDQWLTQLRKGLAELGILRLVRARGELHGYALVRELLSLGPFIAGESTVYPIVKRLEAEGLLTSRWAEASAGPPRKYYALSSLGAAFLEEADQEWRAIVDSMSQIEKGDPR